MPDAPLLQPEPSIMPDHGTGHLTMAEQASLPESGAAQDYSATTFSSSHTQVRVGETHHSFIRNLPFHSKLGYHAISLLRT